MTQLRKNTGDDADEGKYVSFSCLIASRKDTDLMNGLWAGLIEKAQWHLGEGLLSFRL